MTKNQKVKNINVFSLYDCIYYYSRIFTRNTNWFYSCPNYLAKYGNNDGWGTSWPQIWYNFGVGAFLTLALIGLPVLTGGNGGAASFLGPSGGYRMAWLFTPFLIGFFLKKLQNYSFKELDWRINHCFSVWSYFC